MANYVSSFANGAAVDAELTKVANSNLSATHKITRSATLVVAASDSSAKSKAQADYVCDGTADNVELQAALDALPATGGEIHLLDGTFQLAATVARAIDNVTWSGCGVSTYVKYNNTNYIISVGAQEHWSFVGIRFDFGGIELETGAKWGIAQVWRDWTDNQPRLIDFWSYDNIAPRSCNNFMSETRKHPLVSELVNFEGEDFGTASANIEYVSDVVLTHTKSIKITTDATLITGRTATYPDTTNCSYGMWVYIPDASKIASIRLYRYTGSPYNYCARVPYTINSGWQFMVFDAIEEHVYNTPVPSNTTRIGVEIYPTSGETAVIYIDSICYWKRSMMTGGIVTFTFDDGFTEVESLLLPVFQKYGYRGAQSLIISRLSDDRIQSAKKLQNAGWDVVNHSYDHISSTVMTSRPAWEYLLSQKWLADNGFERGSKFVFLGWGAHDKNLIDYVTGNAAMVRGYGYKYGNALPALGSLINTYNVTYETTVANIQSLIDSAISTPKWINICFHNITNTPSTGYDWSPAQVDAVLAYCQSTGVQVMTYSDVMRYIQSTSQRLELSGTGTIANGTTSINIRHGFHKAPKSIQITPTSSLGSAASIWVSSKDTGTGNLFTVSVNTNPGADVTFEWVAVL